MRLTVESCSQIKINDLQKKIRKIIRKDYPGASETEVYNHTLAELKKFTVNNQTFDYYAQKNYLGGFRWFFICPKCKLKVNKLILPPENAKGREHLYLCKKCHRVKNLSVVMGQNSMYQKVTKPLKRMKEIEDKIAAGHLSVNKVQELLDEYDKLEANLKSSPEYRIYMFKKRHNLI